ncbi:hypothetical protein [Halosegnis longus]|uniref:hypothetical protein n=1 Tax=Halosegnis longus TaxID=2216012 RepID=UPI00129E74C3|nr:hypothetical protein [Halosegnis longus]
MTDNEDNDQTVACPICGDYEGKVSSVKSHITGTGTGEHEGKSGGQYDELLRRRAGLLDEDDADDEPDDDTDKSDEQADESGETDDADDTEDDVATPEEYQAQQERLNSDDEDNTDDEPAATEPVQTSGGGLGGLGGLVDNIPTKYLVVGLLMALVVAYLMLSGDESEEDVVDVDAQEPDDAGDDDTLETGVMLG